MRPAGEVLAVATRADLSGAVVLEGSVPAGDWRVFRYRAVPAVGGHNTRVDLLNPEAVQLYLDLYYEELARRFPEHLGRTLQLTVADHEGGYGTPIAWTPRLFEEFARRKGYRLESSLLRLTREGGEKPRRDYYEVLSAMYAEAFTERVAGWCQAQGPLLYAKGSWGLRFETELDRLERIKPNGLEGPVRILTASPR